MSLAATLAADGMRPASFLPTIKCSMCAEEIEISAMGNHICGKGPPSPKATYGGLGKPSTLRSMNANNSKPAQPSPLQFGSGQPQPRSRAPTVTSGQTHMPRAPRPAPPPVNTDFANRPFLARHPDSPASPVSSVHSGSSGWTKQPPPRSYTNPLSRQWESRPPSPEYSPNLDCAFPPFPSQNPPAGQKTAARSVRSPSRSDSRQASNVKQDQDNTALRSHMTAENVMNKMNTLRSGPFDPTGRRPSNHDRSQQDPRQVEEWPGMVDDRPSQFRALSPQVSAPSNADASPTSDLESSNLGPNPFLERDWSKKKAGASPRINAEPSDLGPNPFLERAWSNKKAPRRPAGPSAAQSMTSQPSPSTIDRSQTFPKVQESSNGSNETPALSRMASEPALRNRAAPTDPTYHDFSQNQSGIDTRLDSRMRDAPPVPLPLQTNRPISRQNSDSSTASSMRSVGVSYTSSVASPITSTASSVDAFSPLSNEAGQYGEDKGMRVPGLNIKSHQRTGMRPELSKEKAPLKDFQRSPSPKESEPQSLSNKVYDPNAAKSRKPELTQLSSDVYDPFKAVSRDPSPAPGATWFSRDIYNSSKPTTPEPLAEQSLQGRTRSKTRAGPDLQALKPDQYVPSSTAQHLKPPAPLQVAQPPSRSTAPRPPPFPQSTSASPSTTRRGPTAGKPPCRGCSKQIEGKSVKAADGRLTGRWHKACFVCMTCREPFTTADFYVINDNPYCEQHYHEKNDSVCRACNKGIEGQYLETEGSGGHGTAPGKYHRRCFTCVDCRMVLSEDYFEIAGQVYCERHALASMRGRARMAPSGGSSLGPSNLRAERRTTRLVMM